MCGDGEKTHARSAGATCAAEVLDSLIRRGFAVVRLRDDEARFILDAAARAGEDFLGASGDEAKHRCSSRKVLPRHPNFPKLVLHGLGWGSTPAYGGREQFHVIHDALDICPWPSEEFRAVFEAAETVLRELCLHLLGLLGEEAVAEFHSQITADGDPSVCDAFLYTVSTKATEQGEQTFEEDIAMDSHLDPGWFTAKQGSNAHGLHLWDRERNSWVDAEDPSFYDAHGCSPRDAVVIFAGERAASFTEGSASEVPAVPHRVVKPRGPRPRESFIFELRDHLC